MKYKLTNLFDSIISSGVNFLITFFLLKSSGQDAVVFYGVAMTLSLVLMSFQRSIILLPFNLSGNAENKSSLLRLSFDSVYLYVVSILIVLLYTVIKGHNFEGIVLVVTIFSYMYIHELTRYMLLTTKYFFVALLTSSVLSTVVLFLFIDSQLSFKTLAWLYVVLIMIEISFIIVFLHSIRHIDKPQKSKSTFTNFRLLLSKNLQSCSQLFLVHFTILVVAETYSTAIASGIFIARSIFQPVQIITKTLESFDQRHISISNENLSLRVIAPLLIKYFLVSSFISIFCLIIASYILPYFYDAKKIPMPHTLVYWAGIFVLLSLVKCFDMYSLKQKMYFKMNIYYFISGALTVSLIWGAHYLDLVIEPSLTILLGWTVLVVLYLLSLFGWSKPK